MIGMPSAFALGIFSGKFIFIFVFQKSLRAFLKHFFTVGSLWETASYTKEPLHTRFVQWLFIFTPFYCALYTLPIVQELSARYLAWFRR